MAVQIGLPGYPMRPPTQFMQPPPTLPAQTATFALPSSPVIHQPEQTLHHVKPQLLPPSPSRTLQSQSAGGMAPGGLMASGSSYDGRRMRSKTSQRRTVDYNASLVNYIHNRVWQRDHRDQRAMQPDPLYSYLLLPPAMLNDIPINAVTTRSVRTATNKIKCPVFCTCWTPEGRRLVTGASSGEFTLWNGLTFSFETILQAHDSAVRSMIWSHNDHWMLTGDHNGFVKYWQSNMNNVKMYQAHKDPVRGLSFCPTDQKFATCSDDGTVRIWDFFRCHEEKILRGHGADVKCVDWHPHKSLLASGSKDSQQPVKLWDPRTGSQLATIHAHKNTVMDLKWNKNGNWLMTASRDHLLKLFDIRQMKEELQMFRGHKKEATTIAWHPIHECLFASGGSDGAIMFWLTSNDKEIGSIDEAHEGMVWTLSWHPLGHVLVSGSNDHTTKFWTRNRLGDAMRDRYNLNTLPYNVTDELADDMESLVAPAVPGLEVPQQEQGKKLAGVAAISVESETAAPAIPGLDISDAQTANSGSHVTNVDSASAAAVAAARRKNIYTKPIPKEFERAWAECRPGAGGSGPTEGSQPPVGLLGDMPGDDRPFTRHPEPLLSSHEGPSNWRGPQPLLRPGAPSQQSGPNMGFSAGPRGPGPSDQSRHSGGMPRPLLAPGEMNPPGAVGRGQPRSSGPRPLLPAPSSAMHQDDRPPFGWSNAPPGGNSNQFFDEYGGPCDFDDNGMPGNMDMNGPGPMQGPGQRGQGNRGPSGSHQGPVPLLGGPDQMPRPSGGTSQMSGTRLRGPGPLLGPRGPQQAVGPRGPGLEPWQGPGPEHWQRDADSWQHEPGGPMLGPDSEHWQGPGPRHAGPGGPGQFGPRGPGPNQGPGFHPADEGNDGQFGRWPQRPPDMDGPDHSAPFRAPGGGGPLRPPPSLLDLNVKPPMPKGGGMKRKWEPGGPLLENDDRPPMDIEGPPGPGPFGHPSDMMGPGPGYMQPDDEMSDLAGGKGFSRVAPTMRSGSRGHRGMRGGRGR